MKILLVAPRFIQQYGQHYVFPIGLAYISSALKAAGHQVECLNLNNCQDSHVDALVRRVTEFAPDVIGCGGLSVHFRQIREIFETARLVRPETFLIAGGGIISSEPELMLASLGADAGVIGEGEVTVVNLMTALSKGQALSTVDGIVHRAAGGAPVRTREAKRITNLDDLPIPDYEGFGFEEFLSAQRTTDDYFYHTTAEPRSLDIISSRSCPYDCSFCFHPLGRVYRERSLDNFFAELEFLLSRYRINRVAVLDELFAVKKERLQEFCRRIKPYGIKWMAQLRVDILDHETLQLMHDSNCQVISYGIESACDAVLAGMKKKTTRAQIENALALSYQNRVGIQGNLIFGDTTETYDTMLESLEWWADNRHYTLWLSPIQHYPGTKIYRDGVSKGSIPDRLAFHEQGCPLINTTGIPDETYRELLDEILFIGQVSSFPGRLVHLEKTSGGDPLRGDTYRSICVCPHCMSLDEHARFTYDGSGRPLQRITCHTCQQRYDIPHVFTRVTADPLPETMFPLALKHFSAGNLSTAANTLAFALSRENRHAASHYLLGEIFLSAGDLQQARACLRNAIRLDPLTDYHHTTYAEVQRQLSLPVIARIFDDQIRLLAHGRNLPIPIDADACAAPAH